MATARILVNGRVQGVFYRQSTRDKAKSLGLCGWVRNLDDGRVEIESTGPRVILDQLVVWCHDGPPNAHVLSVDVEWSDEDKHGNGFSVR